LEREYKMDVPMTVEAHKEALCAYLTQRTLEN